MNGAGIITSRDSLTIRNNWKDAWDTVVDFAELPPEKARTKYQLGDDTSDWEVQLAQNDLKASGLDPTKIKPLLYRLFDVRYT